MCGVFAYAGEEPVAGAAVMQGLRALEYRGYDSWGIAVAHDHGLELDKQVGRVGASRAPLVGPARVGMGHTRWATHGSVTVENAHPHADCSRRLAVVHNGIVDNHRELRTELAARGHRFRSETDTEVIAHLIEEEYAAAQRCPDALLRAVCRAGARLQGSSAIIVLDAQSFELVGWRAGSSLLVGLARTTTIIASDAAALTPHTRDAIFLRDGEAVSVSHGRVCLFNARTLQPLAVRVERLDWSVEDQARGEVAHDMLREIIEQPAQWRRWASDPPDELEDLIGRVAAARSVVICGCGTALHAAMLGKFWLATLANVRGHAVPASEFAGALPDVGLGTLCLALSQSGETADVLDAARTALAQGATLTAMLNAPGSSLSRLAERVVRLRAGPERCVLATKSFSAKLCALLLLTASLCHRVDEVRREMNLAADAADGLLEHRARERSRLLAEELARHEHLYVLGRGASYPLALEAALKVKEGSYVHAEGFAGGELKHGVIALVEPGTPCIAFVPNDATRSLMHSSAAEIAARGGLVVGLASERDPAFDRWLTVADAGLATSLVATMASQLLAYDVALARGVNPDRPRNLAKSVTVR
jgi:glucosamine--fructose-6-phosphate aminotransferase (isomerizing)